MEYSENAYYYQNDPKHVEVWPEVFSGQHGEQFLMSAVKDLSSNTRRQSASYVQELASRVWERGIIDTVFNLAFQEPQVTDGIFPKYIFLQE